jgi:hypothetical protein
MRSGALRITGLVAAAMVVAAVTVAPAYAQPYASGWYTLAPGQYTEWDLVYPGNGNPAYNNTATVDVTEVPTGAIGFKVFTDAQWKQLAGGQTVTEIGDGTQSRDSNNNLLYNGDLLWQAGTPQGGLYHIQFYNGTGQPAQYRVSLIGVGTIYPYSGAAVGPVPYYYAPYTQAQPPYYYGPSTALTVPVQVVPYAPPYAGAYAYGSRFVPRYNMPFANSRGWGWWRFWDTRWQ